MTETHLKAQRLAFSTVSGEHSSPPSHLPPTHSPIRQLTQGQVQSKPWWDCPESNLVLAPEEAVIVLFPPSEGQVYLIQVIPQSNFAGY